MKKGYIFFISISTFFISTLFVACASPPSQQAKGSEGLSSKEVKTMAIISDISSSSESNISSESSVSSIPSSSNIDSSKNIDTDKTSSSSTGSLNSIASKLAQEGTSSLFHYDNGKSGDAHVEVTQTLPPLLAPPKINSQSTKK